MGGLVDLGSYFAGLNAGASSSAGDAPEILIHVIDSHRPINLNNLFSSTEYSSAYFDLRRRAKDQVEQERLQHLRLNGGIAVIIWSDDDEDSRTGEREAFDALQVSYHLSL